MSAEEQKTNSGNNDEKSIVKLGIILSIFFSWLPALIIWLTKKETFSPYSNKAITRLLNFEIMLTIITVAVSFVPVLNIVAIFAAPLIFIFNLVICLQANKAVDLGQDYTYPIDVQLIS